MMTVTMIVSKSIRKETFTATANNGVANSIKTDGEPKAICRDKRLQEVLSQYVETFENKALLRHRAQSLERFLMVAPFKAEDNRFFKTATPIRNSSDLLSVNINGPHTVYKEVVEGDESLTIKVRIALLGNEENQKDSISKDCFMYPSAGVLVLESIVFMFSRKL